MSAVPAASAPTINSPRQVLFASLVGTTIEFFDFYIFGTAAVLVFPVLFFPASDPATARLAALATFGIAFLARPVGSTLFGHFGDRIGRKTTLVIALSTMGVSTVGIGLLPTYSSIGLAAPLLLATLRFGQGIGLGGEWGGAVLLAIENAPPHKRAWYGMFPQLGAPIGFFFSGGVFLLLSHLLTDKQFFDYGWRLPFLASAVLVFLGLYVRLTLSETPVFQQSLERNERLAVPVLTVLRQHAGKVFSGMCIALTTHASFYLITVFTLSWATSMMGYSRGKFLLMQLGCMTFCAITIPISALAAEHGRRRVLLGVAVAMAIYGIFLGPLFSAGTTGAVVMMSIGLALMGITYAPLGTLLSELFPTPVRYTGSSLAFSFAGILGASIAPSIATWLARNHGINFVGYYLSGVAVITLLGLLSVRETKDRDLAA
jgi:metabolite-proton symporter